MVCHASLSLQPHSPHANKRKGSDTEARVIRQEAKESIAQTALIHNLSSDKHKKTGIRK